MRSAPPHALCHRLYQHVYLKRNPVELRSRRKDSQDNIVILKSRYHLKFSRRSSCNALPTIFLKPRLEMPLRPSEIPRGVQNVEHPPSIDLAPQVIRACEWLVVR
jgi:hypothetical protein